MGTIANSMFRGFSNAGRLFSRVFTRSKSSTAGASEQNFYQKMLAERPILTKSLTSAIVVGTGDFFCQVGIEEVHKSEEGYRVTQTAKMALIGGPSLVPPSTTGSGFYSPGSLA